TVAAAAAAWLTPVPILHATSYMRRGKLIARHHPRAVRRAQFVDLAAIFILIQLATNGPLSTLFQGMPAAPLAAIAYNLMLCVDIVVLAWSLRRIEWLAG